MLGYAIILFEIFEGPRPSSDVCNIGERQSPINLDDVDSMQVEFPLFEMLGHWAERKDGFVLINTGHSGKKKYILFLFIVNKIALYGFDSVTSHFIRYFFELVEKHC